MKQSWKQYLNNGDENIYDLLTGAAIFNIPATSVHKTELEILFEVNFNMMCVGCVVYWFTTSRS